MYRAQFHPVLSVAHKERPVFLTNVSVNRKTNREHHVFDDPDGNVSVCFETHEGHRDGHLRRCVAHSSHHRSYTLPHTILRSGLAGHDLRNSST